MKENNYKIITKKAYNSVAKKYVECDKRVTPETFEVRNALKQFISLLPPRAKVLDIGSGGGRGAQFFFKHGLQMMGIDFSRQMIEEARKLSPGIIYKVMDIEQLKFRSGEFDGVWANASLHHMPKSRIRLVLKKIYVILKKDGIFFLKVKYGKGEGMRENIKFGKRISRYFAFYRTRELKKIIKDAGFIVLSNIIDSRREWIDVFAKR